MNSLRILAAGAAFVLFVPAASAHGVWLAERWGETGIIYGHGAGDDPYDPAKVTRLEAFDSAGKPLPIKSEARGKHAVAVAEGEPAVVIVEFDNGFWSKGADGKWVNKGKSAVPGATEAGHYVKYNVSLYGHGDAVPALPAQTLQVVPLANPVELGAGKPLKVRVLFEGKPLAGAEIMPDYVNASEAILGKTDANGEAEVTVRNDGLNVIAVSHELAVTGNPDADTVGHFATLSFVAGGEHTH